MLAASLKRSGGHLRLLDDLRRELGPDALVTDDDVLRGHLRDWTGRWRGEAVALARPSGRDDVQALVAAARTHAAALVPQGGNTGLVGGGVPRADLDRPQVVVSTSRMDDVALADDDSGDVVAGAGATLGAVQRSVAAGGRELGIDLAARDTATVGGIVATNAGGLQVVGFGTTRQRLRGVGAVTGAGDVVDHLRGLVKDNTGYELPGLLCGSEGTLGLVTRVRLATSPAPVATAVAVLALDGRDAVADAARVLRDLPGLRALELCRRRGIELVLGLGDVPPPPAWQQDATHWLTVEVAAGDRPWGHDGAATSTSTGADVGHALVRRLADVAAGLGVVDAAVAADRRGRARLWAWRERQTEAVQALGVPVKLDVAVPPGAVGELEGALERVVAPTLPHGLVSFGHVAEGNEHVQLLAVGEDPDVAGPAEAAVLDIVTALGGSISAEHGIGVAKRAALRDNRGAGDLATMRAVQRALDPDGVMNPGVLLP